MGGRRFSFLFLSLPLHSSACRSSGEEEAYNSHQKLQSTIMASSLNVDLSRPTLSRAMTGLPTPPVTAQSVEDVVSLATDAVLELTDGTAFRGISFGAEGKSIAGECVFQTGERRLSFFSLSWSHEALFSPRFCGLQAWSDTPSR